MRFLLPVGTGLLAAFMAFMGFQKLMGPNPVFSYLAEQSGIALFEPGGLRRLQELLNGPRSCLGLNRRPA